jgi:hypothetical protein
MVGGARGLSWTRRRDATSRERSVEGRCRGGSCSGMIKWIVALRLRLPEEPRVAALRVVAFSPEKLSFRGGCELQAYGLGHMDANIRTATASVTTGTMFAMPVKNSTKRRLRALHQRQPKGQIDGQC